MKTICFIISDIDKALPFEWQAEGLKDRFHLHYILLNKDESTFENYLRDRGFSYQRIPTENYLILWLKLYKILSKSRPDLVHCHLRKAEIGGIVASWLAGIKHRIYTRHSSTYNHLYHRKGVWVDKMINRLSTGIIAISKNVQDILMRMEAVAPTKIHLLPHGFMLDEFKEVPESRLDKLRAHYNIKEEAHVIGVIARFTLWKGFESILPALKEYQGKYPDTIFVFANASGNDKHKIHKLISDNLNREMVREIVHEKDIAALYKLFSVYLHTPIDAEVEAFGQTYVEALAAGIPGVFTLSGIAPEFIKHEYNALVVPFNNSKAISEALYRINEDKELNQRLVSNGYISVKPFGWDLYISKLRSLYENQING